jgi:hypothetical protein
MENKMNDNNNARNYTGSITDELRMLNAALQSPDDLQPLFGNDYDADELNNELSVLTEYLNAYTLDVSVRIDARGIDRGATVIITRTVGGPSCYIERDTNDGEHVTVTTYMDGGSFTDRIGVGYVAAWLDELAESYA